MSRLTLTGGLLVFGLFLLDQGQQGWLEDGGLGVQHSFPAFQLEPFVEQPHLRLMIIDTLRGTAFND